MVAAATVALWTSVDMALYGGEGTCRRRGRGGGRTGRGRGHGRGAAAMAAVAIVQGRRFRVYRGLMFRIREILRSISKIQIWDRRTAKMSEFITNGDYLM